MSENEDVRDVLRYVILCDDEFAFYLAPSDSREGPLFLCADAELRRRLVRWGVNAVSGKLQSRGPYRRHRVSSPDRVGVFIRDLRSREKAVQALLEYTDLKAVTVVVEEQKNRDQGLSSSHPRIRRVSLTAVCRNGMLQEMEKTLTAHRVRGLQAMIQDQEKVLLLIQQDPDPDAIASALAMRILLGRNKLSAPIASFGRVSRPENQAMLQLLDIEVVQIQPSEVEGFDRIVLLDVHPSRFREFRLPVHAIVDHHPETEPCECPYKDIRPEYGATCTILTEYLQAAEIKISQKLATALLYGIKTDTLWLGREAAESDLRAFSSLYPLANHRLISRMDRPQLPRKDLKVLSNAFGEAHIEEEVLFVHLEDLSREDVVPYIADFCLQVEGVEWAVVSGVYQKNLVVSARNYGYTKNAGEVLRAAFSGFGSAGGHRSMAKAVMALRDLEEKEARDPWQFVRKAFLQAYRSN